MPRVHIILYSCAHYKLKTDEKSSFTEFLIQFNDDANRFFSFESNLESAIYTMQALTQPDGLQAYSTGLYVDD